MDMNLKVIFLALLLSSFVEGLFAFVTPFYLTSLGISFFSIGLIFSVAALAMVLIRVLFGAYTDIRGRKVVFASSFLLQAVSNAFFPFARSILDTAPVKILYDLGFSVKTSLKSTIIFENARETYRKVIAWVAGLEHLMMALVNFGAAAILSSFAFSGSYFLMTVLQFTAFVMFLLVYKEKTEIQKSRKVSFRDMYDFHLKRNMWVVMVANALFFTGISLSHGFAEPLYWEAKYALSKLQIGLVIGLHRLSLALPLFVTGAIMHRLNVKRAYIFASLAIAASLAAMGLVNNIYVAIPIWLLHDVFGGSIQVPSSQVMIQLNARDDKRGKDTNMMQFSSGLVSIVAPSLTGALITIQWDLIFILGGLLTLAASMIIYLFYREPEETISNDE